MNPAPEDSNGWSYSYSEATLMSIKHSSIGKQMVFWQYLCQHKGIFSDYKEIDGKMYYSSGYEYLSKLMLIKAEPGKDLEIYDEVDHSSFYDSKYWWDNPDVRRSIFMEGGDYIYAISEKGITAHNVETMEQTGSVELPSKNKPSYSNYYEDIVFEVEEEVEEESEGEETE